METAEAALRLEKLRPQQLWWLWRPQWRLHGKSSIAERESGAFP